MDKSMKDNCAFISGYLNGEIKMGTHTPEIKKKFREVSHMLNDIWEGNLIVVENKE